MLKLLSGICLTLLAVLAVGPHLVYADSPLIRTEPASNAILAASPSGVVLVFSVPVNGAASNLTLYGSDSKAIELSIDSSTASGPNQLSATLPQLSKGVYEVVWSAEVESAPALQRGAFGFMVDASGGSPAVVRQPKPVVVLSPLSRVITKALAFMAIMTFVGALTLRIFVTRPVENTLPDGPEREELAATTDRYLALFAVAALLVFLAAWLGQTVYESGAAAKAGFWQSFHLGLVRAYFRTPAGHIRELQTVASIATVAIYLTLTAAALRARDARRRLLITAAMSLGLAGALIELLIGTLPATHPADVARAYFTSLLDWGHILSGAFWLGGLAALLMLALRVRLPVTRQSGYWPAVIRRFSLLATLSVALTIPTGLWTFWIHVGSPALLLTTVYGRTLLLKLALVATLVAIGGFNQVWLLPRLERLRAGQEWARSYADQLLGHFRLAITAEVMIGAAVLLIVPFLSGSARNQSFQAKTWDLTQRATADGLPVRLTPSALQPGLTNYDVSLLSRAEKVELAFASKEIGVPETKVVVTSQGGGEYRVTGLYTPLVGNWQARVLVTGLDKEVHTAEFGLPIQAQPITARATAPPIRASTWEYGAVEVAVAWLLILAANRLSRRKARSSFDPPDASIQA